MTLGNYFTEISPTEVFVTEHLEHTLHTIYFAPSPGAPATAGVRPEPRTLLIQHGLGEHSGRFAHVAEYFAAEGYHVFAWDHQGHGRSSGKRGVVSSWQALSSEVNSVRAEVERRLGRTQTYLWGHSMGGLLALHYLHTNPAAATLRAAVVTAPALALSFEPSPLLVRSARLLSSLAPNVTKDNEIDIDDLSRERGVVSLFGVDPLTHTRVSMRLGTALLHEPRALLEGNVELPCPVLIMHGEADGVCHVDGSRKFAARATGGAPVTLRVWPELYHEIHNEPERAEVLATARDWLAERW